MDNFVDHMIFVCISGAIIASVLGVWCYIWERIFNRFPGLKEKMLKFWESEETED